MTLSARQKKLWHAFANGCVAGGLSSIAVYIFAPGALTTKAGLILFANGIAGAIISRGAGALLAAVQAPPASTP